MSKKIIFSLLFLLLFTKNLSAEALLNTHHLSAAQILGIGTSRGGTLTTNRETGFFFFIQREIIEWDTISKIIPLTNYPGNLIYTPIFLNQVGTKYLVTFAQIEWKGKIKELELERTPIKSETAIERTISEFPISITMDN